MKKLNDSKISSSSKETQKSFEELYEDLLRRLSRYDKDKLKKLKEMYEDLLIHDGKTRPVN